MTTLYVYHQQVFRSELAKYVDGMKAKVGSDWYFINFSLKKPDLFKNPTHEQLVDWSDATTGGRLFGPCAEVKWQLHGKDLFDLWTLQEDDPGVSRDGWTTFENVTTPENKTKFYCIGAWDGDSHSFREGRLPNSLNYPFQGRQKGDRVFFEAAAYSPAPPMQSDGKIGTVDEIMEQLNKPRVLAYRLTGMGCDQGEDPPQFAREEDSDGS